MIVNCVVYERGQKLSDIPLTEVRSHLQQRDHFVWVALKDPEPSELAALQEEFSLHELAIEDAQKGHQRPKIEEYGSSLFVVLHLIEPAGTELQTGEIAIFVGPQYIVSVRRDAQLGFADVRRRCEQECADEGGGFHRTKMDRNSRANGDTVTSPLASENGRDSPWLFASTMKVSPRPGTVSTSEDEALSATPNCQTMRSPAYD